jgi:hypothetical protein
MEWANNFSSSLEMLVKFDGSRQRTIDEDLSETISLGISGKV